MRLTAAYRDKILTLLSEFQRDRSRKGENWSDTRVSLMALNDRNFIGVLQRWDGKTFTNAPTIERIAKFESWLAKELGAEKYQDFIRRHEASEKV